MQGPVPGRLAICGQTEHNDGKDDLDDPNGIDPGEAPCHGEL